MSQVERISLAEDLNAADFFSYSSQSEDGRLCTVPYFKGTGRFSLTSIDEKDIKNRLKAVGTKLKKVRKGNRTLVIGTGEFMYVPMRIATELGKGILFHSTTRSPIFPHENSLIFNKFRFNSPEHSGAVNYLYNILESDYDEVFVIIERVTNEAAIEELVAILQQVKIPHITIVTLANV